MHILITGASGFVGHALCVKLNNSGYKVRRVVRTPDSYGCSLSETYVTGDLQELSDWNPLVTGVDSIVHLAAKVHTRWRGTLADFTEYERMNVAVSVSLAKAAATQGVKRFVFLSSIGVNGTRTTKRPFVETDTPNPRGPYALSKFRAEEALRDLCERTGMELVVVRPPLIYGPGAPGNFALVLKLIRTGIPLPFASINNARSMISIDNIIDFIVNSIEHPSAANQTFMVCDSETVSTRELVRYLAAAMGKRTILFRVSPLALRLAAWALQGKLNIEPLLSSLVIDANKARRMLNWNPPISLAEGLRRAVNA